VPEEEEEEEEEYEEEEEEEVKDIWSNMYFSERGQHKLESKPFHTVANYITNIEMVNSASTSCQSNINTPCSFLCIKTSLQRICDKF